MDNLDRCMIECEKAGYGVHYGTWRAAQGDVLIVKEIPEGFKKCEYCGELYKPKSKRLQKYCGAVCQTRASNKRFKEKQKERSGEK